MSKRTDLLKSMFAIAPTPSIEAPPSTSKGGADAAAGPAPSPSVSPASSPAPAPAPNAPSPSAAPAGKPRVAAGAVRSLGLALGSVEQENERLRQLLAAGAQVVELDPALCRGAPLRDRLAGGDEAPFAALKASIAAHGQEVPILVRPAGDGYQVAYGHRRLKAVAELGLKVRAVVKPLTDAELILAQGLENSARQDLSWIEKAGFAAALEATGFTRDLIGEALSLGKFELSRMIATVAAIPRPLIEAIGPAPRAGRPRWMQLAALMPGEGDRLAGLAASDRFKSLDSNARLALLLRQPEARDGAAAVRVVPLSAEAEARLDLSGRTARLTLADPAFALWLGDRLSDLYRDFQASDRPAADDGQGEDTA